MVFDIETVGIAFDDLDTIQQQHWLKSCETDEEVAHEKTTTGLSPLTGFVCAIAMLNTDSCKGKVLAIGSLPSRQAADVNFMYMEHEADLLTAFWEAVKKYDQLISFNGRGFDVPFLMLRSAIHRIRPSRNLMGQRYSVTPHCDLADQLSFYGATKRQPLHTYLRAFDIPTSKDGSVEGSQVTEAYNQGRIQDIAEYCFRDVVATAELFKVWQAYINI